MSAQEFACMVVERGQGDVVAGHGADEDVRRRLEDLERRNGELAAAVAARNAFLTIAAHELRNPMTPIVGQVQRLRRQVEARACSLEEVEQALRRVEWLIDLYVKRATTLLDVSRITSGKLRLEIQVVNVSQLVRNMASALEPVVQYAGSILQLQVPDGLIARADRLALEQILDNLLLNALKYGAGKPIAVAIARDGATLLLEVRDRGIGISTADQARIFEPFERAIAYAARSGFGVGLWVVRQLVEAMGGDVRVESVPNSGTTFTVTIPQP